MDCSFYTPQESYKEGNYYLLVSAFAPYKRIDVAIDAFEKDGGCHSFLSEEGRKKCKSERWQKNTFNVSDGNPVNL